jgi:hypothetical protein
MPIESWVDKFIPYSYPIRVRADLTSLLQFIFHIFQVTILLATLFRTLPRFQFKRQFGNREESFV